MILRKWSVIKRRHYLRARVSAFNGRRKTITFPQHSLCLPLPPAEKREVSDVYTALNMTVCWKGLSA